MSTNTYLKEKFGDTEVFIATKVINGPIKIIGSEEEDDDEMAGFNMNPTSGIVDMTNLKKMVKDVVESFGNEMSSLNTTLKSSSISLELSLTLSQGGWIIGLESEQAIKLKIDWKSPQP